MSNADIKFITIHCSASKANQALTKADIERMHKQRGFISVGYHYIIRRDGLVEAGRPEFQTGAHVEGHNKNNLGVCWIGGIDAKGKGEDNRTDAQKKTLVTLIRNLKSKYPNAKIKGHRDWSPDLNRDGVISKNEWLKECPCFDVNEWLKSNGISN